jgi:ribosome maturation factor RimP
MNFEGGKRSLHRDENFAAWVGERFHLFDVSSAEVDEWFRLRVATVNGEDFCFQVDRLGSG